MASIAVVRKHVFRQIKRAVGEQSARRMSISARRALYKMKLRPSIKPKHAVHIQNVGVYLAGNIIDVKGKLKGLELVLDNGQSIDIFSDLVRLPSDTLFGTAAQGPGKKPAGFAVFARYPTSMSAECRAVGLRLHFAKGRTSEQKLSLQDSDQAPLLHVQNILAKVPVDGVDKRRLFDDLFGPAVQSIWQSRKNKKAAAEEVHYNEHLAPHEPEVSVIVPIYGRYDFIEHQLSLFIRDPDMTRHELIYVIDDPRLLDEIDVSCDALSRIYPMAFRVLRLEHNMGYAGANNVGVEHARGESVLLLNSDVMPESPGWLRDLLNTVGDTLSTSITGARLLYEDRTVQHDGMQFFASPFMNDLWTNMHPGKGMPVDVFANTSPLEPREAVTGACLLMTRKNYQRLEGLDENYILGDFEDSDLCLAAHRLGLKVQLAPNIQLFHLERLSQSLVATDRWKQEVTYFNCWQHHGKWNNDISNVKESLKAVGNYG